MTFPGRYDTRCVCKRCTKVLITWTQCVLTALSKAELFSNDRTIGWVPHQMYQGQNGCLNTPALKLAYIAADSSTENKLLSTNIN